MESWHTPVLKLLLTPSLIGAASWAGQRWGPQAAGWFAALPLTSGPILVFLCIERGPAFAASACVGTIIATISLAAFALTYAWSAQFFGWLVSTCYSWLAYLIATLALQFLRTGVMVAYLLSCAALSLATKFMPKEAVLPMRSQVTHGSIVSRMVLAVALVWIITSTAGMLGPTLSGLLTPFPVVATLLAAFTHRTDGAVASTQLLRSLLIGLYSFALFFFILGTLLPVATLALSCISATSAAWCYTLYC